MYLFSSHVPSFCETEAMGKSSASVAKMPLVCLPFVYGMGLNQPQPVQKRQKKKSACVTNEDVPPSSQEVAQLDFAAKVVHAFGFSCLAAAVYSPLRRPDHL